MRSSARSSSRRFRLDPVWSWPVLLTAWLAVYLVFAGQITGALWERGDHATPEQWAAHLQLTSQGAVEHHGQAQETIVAPGDTAQEPSADLVISGAQMTVVLAAPSVALTSTDGLVLQIHLNGAVSAPLVRLHGRSVSQDRPFLVGFGPSPPETPPPIAREPGPLLAVATHRSEPA